MSLVHADGHPPQLPDIMLNWHHDLHLQLTPISQLELPEEMTIIKVLAFQCCINPCCSIALELLTRPQRTNDVQVHTLLLLAAMTGLFDLY